MNNGMKMPEGWDAKEGTPKHNVDVVAVDVEDEEEWVVLVLLVVDVVVLVVDVVVEVDVVELVVGIEELVVVDVAAV